MESILLTQHLHMVMVMQERVVGEAIKGRRDKVVIATKCGIVKEGAGLPGI